MLVLVTTSMLGPLASLGWWRGLVGFPAVGIHSAPGLFPAPGIISTHGAHRPLASSRSPGFSSAHWSRAHPGNSSPIETELARGRGPWTDPLHTLQQEIAPLEPPAKSIPPLLEGKWHCHLV